MSYNPSTEMTGDILLVDDLPENLILLSDLLLALGYSVRCLTNGRMVIKTAKLKRPDIIMLDIKMPDMDGYQVCQALKDDEELRDIPVIFISALDDVFGIVKAFWSGGVDYISKPFRSEEVVVRLENQLTIQRQRRSLEDEIARRVEVEEMLNQSRALITSVLNSVLDGISSMQSIRDPDTNKIIDFRCLVANSVMAKIFDCSSEDLIGELVLEKFLEKFSSEIFELLVNVVESEIPLDQEVCSSSQHSCRYRVVAFKVGDGFTVTLRDINTI